MSNTDFDHENAEFQEEWLSAYLDGELSSEQRAMVEQRVDEDPVMAAMLNDLRKVRSLVSSLPRWNAAELSVSAIMARAEEIEELDSEFPEPDAAAQIEDDFPLDDVDSIVHREPLGGTTDEEFLTARLTRRTSKMRWLRPAAMAASLLLIAGIGYTLWPTGPRSDLAMSTRGDSAPAPTSEAKIQEAASDGLAPELPLPEIENGLALESADKRGEPPLAPSRAAGGLPGNGGGFGGGFGGNSMELSLPDAPESFAMDSAQANMAELPRSALNLPMDSVASQPESLEMGMGRAAGAADFEAAEAAKLAPQKSAVGSNSSPRSMYFAKSSAWSENDVRAAIATSPDLFGKISQSELVLVPSARGTGSVADAKATAILTLDQSDTSQTYESLLAESAWLAPIEELNASSGPPAPVEGLAPNQGGALSDRPNVGQVGQDVDELPSPAVTRQSRQAQTGLIALFLTKGEADDLLQASVLSQTTAAKPGAVFWILAGPSSGRPVQAGERVILLLNSAAR